MTYLGGASDSSPCGRIEGETNKQKHVKKCAEDPDWFSRGSPHAGQINAMYNHHLLTF